MVSVLSAIEKRKLRLVVEGKTDETIDVPEQSGLIITGCKGCTINASGKCGGVTVERCEATTVRIGTVVATLEIICCTAVEVSVQRCQTITVDGSTKISVSHACQAQAMTAEDDVEGKSGDERTPKSVVAEEASAVRLFTSSSDEVSITFEGLSNADTAVTGFKYSVPKDFRYKNGDGPRSVSRVTVDRSNGIDGVRCKTWRCDLFGTPLEMAKANEDGDLWTWEHGRIERST